MAAASDEKLVDFLVNGFSRVGKKTAQEMCDKSGLKQTAKVKGLSAEELKNLLAAMQAVAVPAPPTTQCLSPIGEDLIRRGLDKEFQMDFVAARTRPSSGIRPPVRGRGGDRNGGRLAPEGNATILRFANRVPLMYQQGACAVTECVANVNWKSYNISQQGLPLGPVLILVHVASTNVPFTSESKDAIASIPEIEKEIVLALQEARPRAQDLPLAPGPDRAAEDRARAVCAVIPEIAAKVSEIVEKPVVDTSPIEGRLMRRLIAKKSNHGTVRSRSKRTTTPEIWRISGVVVGLEMTLPLRVHFFAISLRISRPSIGEVSTTGFSTISGLLPQCRIMTAHTARARSSASLFPVPAREEGLELAAELLRASTISFSISGMLAIASLLSLGNGTFVDATWTRINTGPAGGPAVRCCTTSS